MPLAIELAAARIASLSPEEILRRLEDRFALLTAGSRTAAERHRTLRAAVEWSYGLLDQDEQELFRRLSMFRGGFDLVAVEAVAGEGGLDRLSRLIDKSLVTVAGESAAATRYTMLETLAECGEEQLREKGEVESARQAQLNHFVERAEAAFAERRQAAQQTSCIGWTRTWTTCAPPSIGVGGPIHAPGYVWSRPHARCGSGSARRRGSMQPANFLGYFVWSSPTFVDGYRSESLFKECLAFV